MTIMIITDIHHGHTSKAIFKFDQSVTGLQTSWVAAISCTRPQTHQVFPVLSAKPDKSRFFILINPEYQQCGHIMITIFIQLPT